MSASTASRVQDFQIQAPTKESEPLLNQEMDLDKKASEDGDSLDPAVEPKSRIGELPSVHKPGYGNWMWAEQQCARRCGFTPAEARFVQEAQLLHQGGGDPNAFVEGVFSEIVLTGEFWNGLYGESSGPSWSLGLAIGSKHFSISSKLATFLDVLPKIQAVIDSAWSVSPQASLGWAGVNTLLPLLVDREFREGQENRVHLLETISKLLPIVMDTFEARAAPSTVQGSGGNGHPRSEKEMSPMINPLEQRHLAHAGGRNSLSLESQDQDEIAVQNPEPAKQKGESPTFDFPSWSKLSKQERVEGVKTYLQSGRFDLTKLDQKRFNGVIQELLSSRSADQVRASGYIVIGWFPRGSLDPKEKLLKINGGTSLFKKMRKGIRSVRGWRRYISLKSLHKFGLYKCDIHRGAHIKVKPSAQEHNILSHFILAYNASYRHPDEDVTATWTDWVNRELNGNKVIMFQGNYSLELVYSWSAVRLSVAVITPTLFSFAVGLGYMLKTGDVSTAWTISSYIVTAAGAIVALLAILGTLKES